MLSIHGSSISLSLIVLLSLFSTPAFSKSTSLDTRSFKKLEEEIDLSRDELIEIQENIERIPQGKDGDIHRYTLKKRTLPYTVFWNDEMKGFVVTFPHEERFRIGAGFHKRVDKAILFSGYPQVIAACDCDKTAIYEAYLMNSFKNTKGLINLLAMNEYRGGERCMMYLPYYPQRALMRYVLKKRTFLPKDALHIALDIAQGLFALHERGIIHRDIQPHNIYLRKKKKGFEAVLADFGCAIKEQERKDLPPHGVPLRYPPEVLTSFFSEIDLYASDIYALGYSFYEMVYSRGFEGNELFRLVPIDAYSMEKRNSLYARFQQTFEETKKMRIGEFLKKKKGRKKLLPYEKFQLLIFEMLDYSPQNRPTAEEIVKRISSMVQKEDS